MGLPPHNSLQLFLLVSPNIYRYMYVYCVHTIYMQVLHKSYKYYPENSIKAVLMSFCVQFNGEHLQNPKTTLGKFFTLN